MDRCFSNTVSIVSENPDGSQNFIFGFVLAKGPHDYKRLDDLLVNLITELSSFIESKKITLSHELIEAVLPNLWVELEKYISSNSKDAKVNRLLQMRGDIFKILSTEAINADINEKLDRGLEEVIRRIYNSNSNALMYLLGPGDFSVLSVKDLDRLLNYPWSGKTFSNRLWGNISRLEQNLSQSIVNSIQSGEGVLEALRSMRNDHNISDLFKLEEGKFNRAIENLVRTEYAHFAVEGIKESLSDAGLGNPISWSAEDERVCDLWQWAERKTWKGYQGWLVSTLPRTIV